MVCAFSLSYRRTLPREVGRQTKPLPTGGKILDPASQVLEARVQNGPFGFCVGGDLGQALAQGGLPLGRAILERLEGVVALPLERRAQPREAFFVPLRRRASHLV